MKLKGMIFSILALLVVTAVGAQEGTGDVKAAVELTRQMIQTERQAIVAANMDLTEAESEAFWPVYREYRDSMAKVGDRQAALIMDYAKSYETMTDLQAEEMVKEMLDIRKKELSVRGDYVKKMGKVLPPKKVARFFQIENKLDSVIQYELASEIPLVKTK